MLLFRGVSNRALGKQNEAQRGRARRVARDAAGCILLQPRRTATPGPRPGPALGSTALTSAPRSFLPRQGAMSHGLGGSEGLRSRRGEGGVRPEPTRSPTHRRPRPSHLPRRFEGLPPRPLCAEGVVAWVTAPPRPRPRGAPPWSPRCGRPSCSPGAAAAAGSGAGFPGQSLGAKLSLPRLCFRLPAPACSSPRRSAGRIRLTSLPSGS